MLSSDLFKSPNLAFSLRRFFLLCNITGNSCASKKKPTEFNITGKNQIESLDEISLHERLLFLIITIFPLVAIRTKNSIAFAQVGKVNFNSISLNKISTELH